MSVTLLRQGSFSSTPLQNGLVFHGRALQQHLTLVDGLVSEAKDVRTGVVGMTQGTVANRPQFQSQGFYCGLSQKLSTTLPSIMKTVFIVLKNNSGNTSNPTILGLSNTTTTNSIGSKYLGIESGIYRVSSSYPIYYNLNKLNSPGLYDSDELSIFHSFNDMNIPASNFMVGNNNNDYGYIFEWGWYDRVLSENEVLYNINALNQSLKENWGLTAF